LIAFLIAEQARNLALPEILSLAARLPDTIGAHLEVGDLLLRVGDATDAVNHFTWVLRREPHNLAALTGAGQASFALGRYPQARRWLAALPTAEYKSKDMLNLATYIVENDPLDPRLPAAERERRVRADLKQAVDSLQACIAQSPSAARDLQPLHEKLGQQRRLLTESNLRRRPELAVSALDVIYEVENAMGKSCGPLQAADRGLLLITQKSRGTEQ
jgi:tetratricopeptide (TPR) repeat protein